MPVRRSCGRGPQGQGSDSDRADRQAKKWAAPRTLAVGAVVNPFATDLDRELRLLERKVAAGAEFSQSQMVFDLSALGAFLERAADLLVGVHFYASVALLRNERMADHARISRVACCLTLRIGRSDGGVIELATELATELASTSGVDALHIFPLGSEPATREVAAAYRSARPVRPAPLTRHRHPTTPPSRIGCVGECLWIA